MLLQNHFDIDVPIAEAWDVLTDLERVAACMPGTVLEGRDGGLYVGAMKVRVGPIGTHFKGSAAFTEKDEASYRAVIEATGKDPRGGAAATARIQARLEGIGASRTRVSLDTDLNISGRIAQFGRGALADVSHRLLGQFATNLNDQLQPQRRPAEGSQLDAVHKASESIDVAGVLAPVLRDRAGPPLAGALLGFLLGWLVFRGRPRR